MQQHNIDNIVESLKFLRKRRYSVINLTVNVSIEANITKRNDCEKTHKYSNFCQKLLTKSKNKTSP